MSTELDVRSIVAAAAEIASEAFGRPICLECLKRFPGTRADKSIVIRCALRNQGEELAGTVVVKHTFSDDERRVIGFFNDWASCRFLSELSPNRPLCARYIGADQESQILVMEDLGDGEGAAIEEILEHGDRDQAHEALRDYARVIGRLHAQTSGKAEVYYQIREALGSMHRELAPYIHPWSDARRLPSGSDEIARVVSRYRSICERVSVKPSDAIEGEIARVTKSVEECGDGFLAFAQGDQNGLGGFIRIDGRLRAFDFDCGGFRHALREGIPARMTWGCMKRVPRRVAGEMERVYREELSKGCPDALDDATFNRAKVEASAHWHVFHVNVRLNAALENDRQRGPSTLRQQVVAWFAAFAEISEECNDLLALGDCARRIVCRLRKHWPESCFKLPVFGAFR